MFTALSNKPDYVVLSFVGLMIAFATIPYFDQIDLTLGIAPTLDTISVESN